MLVRTAAAPAGPGHACAPAGSADPADSPAAEPAPPFWDAAVHLESPGPSNVAVGMYEFPPVPVRAPTPPPESPCGSKAEPVDNRAPAPLLELGFPTGAATTAAVPGVVSGAPQQGRCRYVHCAARPASWEEYGRHLAAAHGLAGLCPQCLEEHPGAHGSDFACHLCPARFPCLGGLEGHRSSYHWLPVPGRGDGPPTVRPTSDLFVRASASQGPRGAEPLVKCPYGKCLYGATSFYSWGDQVSHFRAAHVAEGRDPALVCGRCLAQLPSAEAMDRHAEKHGRVAGQFECAVCGAQFFRDAVLRQHMRCMHMPGQD